MLTILYLEKLVWSVYLQKRRLLTRTQHTHIESIVGFFWVSTCGDVSPRHHDQNSDQPPNVQCLPPKTRTDPEKRKINEGPLQINGFWSFSSFSMSPFLPFSVPWKKRSRVHGVLQKVKTDRMEDGLELVDSSCSMSGASFGLYKSCFLVLGKRFL